ncbi:hypothetical protein CQW23_19549 [Capsicum baccatum]|uniref:Uncharacterized protein n=1 Tax=Capsicum baccatum TaxID=33114 RepID=A0A2G2W640_CAPBA|nr:hypothetical protein CQW23_19549 [Capsicum baccatum]
MKFAEFLLIFTAFQKHNTSFVQGGGSFATSNKSRDVSLPPVSKKHLLDVRPVNEDIEEVAKDAVTKAILDKLKKYKKDENNSKSIPLEEMSKENPGRTDHRIETGREKNKERERDRDRDRERERDKK